MARLVINPTSASKKEIRIVSRVISIGRDPSNDLVLTDSMVSRRHAILEQREELFVLRDNHSSNGTLVNGDKVETEMTLQDGDLVAIGSSRLLFQLDDNENQSAAPPHRSGLGTSAEIEPARSSKAPSTRSCPACGAETRDVDRFCRGCGQKLDGEAVRCETCGKFVLLPAEFCGHCGKSLSSWEPPPVKPQVGPSRVEGLRLSRQIARAKENVAGLGVRLLAAFVDGMILGIPLLLAALVWVTVAGPGVEAPASSMLVGVIGVAFAGLCIMYFVMSWGLRGATPGMSFLGLSVETEEGDSPIGVPRALVRLASCLLSLLPFGLGLIRVAFREDRLALHDRLSRTRVTVSS
ncbi:MAG TPA: FHA domain-containing protein [Vicinamibacteria bacterium]|nr:FHA domain-containing protein [Vicinamibacteria bacterium]